MVKKSKAVLLFSMILLFGSSSFASIVDVSFIRRIDASAGYDMYSGPYLQEITTADGLWDESVKSEYSLWEGTHYGYAITSQRSTISYDTQSLNIICEASTSRDANYPEAKFLHWNYVGVYFTITGTPASARISATATNQLYNPVYLDEPGAETLFGGYLMSDNATIWEGILDPGTYQFRSLIDLQSSLYVLGTTPYYYSYDFSVSAVPIPGAVWLLGSGLIALAGLRKRFISSR